MSLFASRLSGRRIAGAAAGAAMLLAGAALPARALGIQINQSLLHVQDCRSAALARQLAYDFDFSSNTTGPLKAHVSAVIDGQMTLCWSLDVTALTDVQVWVEQNVTVDGVVGGLLGTGDASKVCTTIHLKVAPGVKGTVDAWVKAHVGADGAPPADYEHYLSRNTTVDSIGEDITLRQCVDTAGNASAS